MTRKHKTIIIYGVLVLLAAALITYGTRINSQIAPSPEEDHAARLAELKADLLKAAESGREPQQTSGLIKRKPARKSTRSGST